MWGYWASSAQEILAYQVRAINWIKWFSFLLSAHIVLLTVSYWSKVVKYLKPA